MINIDSKHGRWFMDLGKFHHDRSLFSRALVHHVFYMGHDPNMVLLFQVSEILQFTQMDVYGI